MENFLVFVWPTFTSIAEVDAMKVLWEGGSTQFSKIEPATSIIRLEDSNTFTFSFQVFFGNTPLTFPALNLQYLAPHTEVPGKIIFEGEANGWTKTHQGADEVFTFIQDDIKVSFSVQPGNDTGILLIGTLDPSKAKKPALTDPLVNGLS